MVVLPSLKGVKRADIVRLVVVRGKFDGLVLVYRPHFILLDRDR
jgi:hypothetical protein